MVSATLFTSNSFEWYTPDWIVQAAGRTMGDIDLDPCAPLDPTKRIIAKRYYTTEDDGLSQPWRGRVFLNPPYGTALPRWIDKLIAEAETVEQAVLLLPNRSDTKWYRKLKVFSRCFLHGRVKFHTPDGVSQFSSPVP